MARRLAGRGHDDSLNGNEISIFDLVASGLHSNNRQFFAASS